MTAGTIKDYIGYGTFAARPVSPSITAVTGGSARYYATDNSTEYAWDGSAWQAVGGGGAATVFSWATKSASYTILTTDSGILVDTSGAGRTITLPTAVAATQRYAIKKKTNDANAVTINTTSGQTIDGFASGAITLTDQNQSIEVESDGTNWYIAARYGMSSAEAKLGADVNITANTFADGPSVSLAPGKWMIWAKVFLFGSSATAGFTAKLWDGTTTIDSNEQSLTASLRGNLVCFGIVNPAATTTYKISATCNTGTGGLIQAAVDENPAGNNASHIVAMRSN